jgi:PPP family 3-phenylpropionic acid transporter
MSTTATPGPHVNLLPLRAFYFFSFGALGALFPYLPLLLAQRDLDPAQISWVMVLIPASNLLVPPLWGSLADALQARISLLRLACVGCGLTVLLLIPRWGLWGNLICMSIFSVFRAPLTSLSDAATYAVMGGKRADFSKVRVWGSVGFTIFVLLLGLIKGSLQPVLLLSINCVIYLAAALSLLPLRAPPIHREQGVLRQTGQILGHAPVLLFLIANTVYYLGHATYDAFFSLHIKRIGFGEQFIGTAWALGAGVEIGLMLAAPLFIHRFRSGVLLSFCAVVASLRWGLLSISARHGSLLSLQPLHGITFGLWYLSMVKYIQTRAPERLRTTLQSVTLASMGLGMIIGYLAGGEMLHRLGGLHLYLMAAAAAGVALLLYVVMVAIGPPVRTRTS